MRIKHCHHGESHAKGNDNQINLAMILEIILWSITGSALVDWCTSSYGCSATIVEFAGDVNDPAFLQSLYQHILFDMRIWGRSQFHVRIGHVQYLSNLIHEDRLSFRKKYGPQHLLDVIKQHYQNGDQSDLCIDDRKTMRQALLGILKLYLSKEITANDISAITGFLWSVWDNEMVNC